MSFVACVREIKRSYFDDNCSKSLESVRKFLVPEHFMWRKVKYCSFTSAFKGLRANLLPSSCFSMNLLVRAGKILFKGGWRQVKKWNKQVFQILLMTSTASFPNWHLGKVSKICRSRMFPCSICRKKQFAGHISEYLCRWLGWVYRCEDVLSILLGFLFNCKYHQQVDDVTQH